MGRNPSMAGLQEALCVFAILLAQQHVDAAQITFTQVPSNLTVQDAAPIVLRCAAAAVDAGAVRYLWEKDGVPYAATQRLLIAAASSSDAGRYVCVATHGSRAIRSKPAVVTVTARSTKIGEAAVGNGTSIADAVAIAASAPFFLLGLVVLATSIISVSVVVCARKYKGSSKRGKQRRMEDQTSDKANVLVQDINMNTEDLQAVNSTHGSGDAGISSEGTSDNVANDVGFKGLQNNPDDLQLDVAMFEHPLQLSAFSAENLVQMTDASVLQRSPKISNLSHIRPPKNSTSDIFHASNLPRSGDAMKRIFHSLVSIPVTSNSLNGAIEGNSCVPSASTDQRVSVPVLISELSSTDVLTAQTSTDAIITIDQQAEPHGAIAESHGLHEVSTVPHEVSTVALEVSTIPHEVSIIPHEVSTIPHEVSIVPHEMSTIPHEVSTIPHEVSTKCAAEPSEQNTEQLTPVNMNSCATAVKTLGEIPLSHTKTESEAAEMKSAIEVTLPSVLPLTQDKASHDEEAMASSVYTATQGPEQQTQPKVSDLRQKFLPGPMESPSSFATATVQRLQRSKLILKVQQLFGGQQHGSDVTEVSSPLQEVVLESTLPGAMTSVGQASLAQNTDLHVQLTLEEVGQVSGDVGVGLVASHQPLVETSNPPATTQHTTSDNPLIRDKGDLSSTECKSSAHGDKADLGNKGHVTPSGNQSESFNGDSTKPPGGIHMEPSREQTETLREGHEELVRGGLSDAPKELTVPSSRPHLTSPVFARHGSKSPSPVRRPTSNLLVSMSAGSPVDRTPPSTRRQVGSPNLPRNLANGQYSAGNVDLYIKTQSPVSSSTPTISSPTPVISSSTRTTSPSSPSVPTVPCRGSASGVQLVESDNANGDGVSSKCDEDTWSTSSEEDLIAPLAMAPPPTKRLDSAGNPLSPHHSHQHNHEVALSPGVKSCVTKMAKIVHTQQMFSEPRKMHTGRQRRKLSAIPEDSPSVTS